MIRRIASISVGTVAAFALAVAPQIASAQVTHVSAAVAALSTVTLSTDVATTTWNGSAAESDPFTVTVTTNNPSGYQLTFTGTTEATGAFEAAGGTLADGNIDYTVTDAAAFSYTNGTEGTTIFPETDSGVAETFDVNWPLEAGVNADTYTDTLNITVTSTPAT
jgi:hypothetical protein